jgi:hypothetical protein
MVATRVISKTITGTSPKEIDDKSNLFREQHDCIATTVNTIINERQEIIYIQTIFYKPQ